MAPFYKGWEPGLSLDQDDISAIRALYGKKPSKATPGPGSTTPPSQSGSPASSPAPPSGQQGLCSDPSIDTILR